VLIDGALLAPQSKQIVADLRALVIQAPASGDRFNIESPSSLQQVSLTRSCTDLWLPRRRPSALHGRYVLEELADLHALPRIILDHRVSRNSNPPTPTNAAQIDPRTGRVHPPITRRWHGPDSFPPPFFPRSEPAELPTGEPEGTQDPAALHRTAGHVFWPLLLAESNSHQWRTCPLIRAARRLLPRLDVHVRHPAEVFGIASTAVSSDHRRTAKDHQLWIDTTACRRSSCAPRSAIRSRLGRSTFTATSHGYPGGAPFHGQHARAGHVATASLKRCADGAVPSRTSAPQSHSCSSTRSSAPSRTHAGLPPASSKLAMIASMNCASGRNPGTVDHAGHDEWVDT